MKPINSSAIRRLMPAFLVSGVLAFSFLAPTPSLASNTNNCGVKGYGTAYGFGFHDHGKACPNRPFPGHGEGVEAKLGTSGEPAANNQSHAQSNDLAPHATVVGATSSAVQTPNTVNAATEKNGHVHSGAIGHPKHHMQDAD